MRASTIPVSGRANTRYAILQRLLAAVPESAAIVASTGKCGRELFTLADRPQHLYQVGSMGCAGPMGLGVALNTARPVIVLDGDGAALMKLGAFATIGAMGTENLVHVILDTACMRSTGASRSMPKRRFRWRALFLRLCRPAPRRRSMLRKGLAAAMTKPGPHPFMLSIRAGSRMPGNLLCLRESADRFKAFLVDPNSTTG